MGPPGPVRKSLISLVVPILSPHCIVSQTLWSLLPGLSTPSRHQLPFPLPLSARFAQTLNYNLYLHKGIRVVLVSGCAQTQEQSLLALSLSKQRKPIHITLYLVMV